MCDRSSRMRWPPAPPLSAQYQNLPLQGKEVILSRARRSVEKCGLFSAPIQDVEGVFAPGGAPESTTRGNFPYDYPIGPTASLRVDPAGL